MIRDGKLTYAGLSRYVPLLIFFAVYAGTCLIGAIVLLVDYRPVVRLWEYFAGTPAPLLSDGQKLLSVVLLVACPALLALGYALAATVRLSSRAAPRSIDARPPPPLAASVVFWVLAFIGLLSIARAGSFTRLDSWLSYQAWIDARWTAFATLSFFEFVNIYTAVPLAAAWCAVSLRGRGVRAFVLRWSPTAVAVLLTLALYQKKAVIIALVIVLAAVLVDRWRQDVPVGRPIALGLLGLVAVYFALVVVPTFNLAVAYEPALQRQRPATVTPAPAASDVPAPATSPGAAPPVVAENDPLVGVTIYSLLAPMMRTSAPALYYVLVFPDHHAFYGPDVGLDIFCSRRIGCSGLRMPDDNIVVWDYMNPALHGGSVTAPYQFGLFAQAGLIGAFVGSILLGALLALVWRAARSASASAPWSSLLSASTVLLAINLALDSPRNGIVVSYGALWAFAFVGLAALAVTTLGRIRPAMVPAKSTA